MSPTEEFYRQRYAALLSMDLATINAYLRRWGSPIVLTDDETSWGGIHKARTALPDFPADEKAKSKVWLAEHGYYHLGDGP